MGTHLIGSILQNVSVRVLQVMLEVLFGELAYVLARVLAEYSEGISGHCGRVSRIPFLFYQNLKSTFFKAPDCVK